MKGFVVLPRRWVVERTFSWFGRNRRLAKDFENLAETLASLPSPASNSLSGVSPGCSLLSQAFWAEGSSPADANVEITGRDRRERDRRPGSLRIAIGRVA
jgi:hypothetical protein